MKRKKYLFICEGNIGRSQMAEAFYNAYTKTKDAISAGVKDQGAPYGYRPANSIIHAMAKEGIDISQQRAKVVTDELTRQADHIVVLCDQSMCPSYITEKANVVYMPITDPFLKDDEQIASICAQIKNLVLKLIQQDHP